jgi:DNA polymerase III alpha subunit
MREPKKFVNLHAHSNGSIGDAISLPPEHFEYAAKNGLDAHAITDHGNMNTFSHSYKYFEELEKKGNRFKIIHGNEAYFIPSLVEWEKMRARKQEEKQQEKQLKTEAAKNKKPKKGSKTQELELLLDDNDKKALEEFEQKVIIFDEGNAGKDASISTEGNEETTVVENEEETKSLSKKNFDPLRQRNHLVLLAKNITGLKSLFKLTSLSYRDGMYYFPRMDFNMLREHAKGNLIGSSACIGGIMSNPIIEHISDLNLTREEFSDHYEQLKTHNFDKIQKDMEKIAWQFVEVLGGIENYYLELQFNKLPYQHILNYHLIQLSKRTGIKLLATADCHYPDPSLWKERMIYKAMAKMTKDKLNVLDISTYPNSPEELECELYPKNASQMWQAYQTYCKTETSASTLYDSEEIDELVCDAIERAYDVAHNLIDDKIYFDRSPKLPSLDKLLPKKTLEEAKQAGLSEEDVAFNELVDLTIQGLTNKNKLENQTYVDRAMEELDVIRHLKLPKYFITCAQSLNLIGKKMLLGAGRGCFVPETLVGTPYYNKYQKISELKPGQFVYSHDGSIQEIAQVFEYDIEEEIVCLEFEDGKKIQCTKDHKFLTKNRGWIEAQNLEDFDEVVEVC